MNRTAHVIGLCARQVSGKRLSTMFARPGTRAEISVRSCDKWDSILSHRWSEGCVRGRRLFQEIKARGYTGRLSNLERLLAKTDALEPTFRVGIIE
jgi:hypothetical protein